MQEAAQGSAQIAESISSVAQAAQDTAEGATSTQASAGDLRQVAGELRAVVDGAARAPEDAGSDRSQRKGRGGDGATVEAADPSSAYEPYEAAPPGMATGRQHP